MPYDSASQLVSFDQCQFRYDPYPIGAARPVFDADIYARMLKEWPPLEAFKHFAKWGNKYSLSETANPSNYQEFISRSEVWRKVHAEIKSTAFIGRMIDFLASRGIDIGLKDRWVPANEGASLGKRLRGMIDGFKLKRPSTVPLVSRFEFSMLPSDGGSLRPHTDDPKKLITMVFSVVGDGQWDSAWGGGTAVLRPKDITKNFNFINRMTDFEESEEICRYEFLPNQCVVFVKTFNSLHSVPPMKSGRPDVYRKSITLVIAEA